MREGNDDCSVKNGFATAFAVQACNLKRGADVVIAACPSEPVRGLGSLSVSPISSSIKHSLKASFSSNEFTNKRTGKAITALQAARVISVAALFVSIRQGCQ